MWWRRLCNRLEGGCRAVGSPHPTPACKMGRDLPPGLGADGVEDREECSCPEDAISSPPDVWSLLEQWSGRKDSLSLASSAVFLTWFPAVLFRLHLCYEERQGRKSHGIFWVWVCHLINKQEQSLAKGKENPRNLVAWNLVHLIAGCSLVPAGENTLFFPAGHGSSPTLLLPSFH